MLPGGRAREVIIGPDFEGKAVQGRHLFFETSTRNASYQEIDRSDKPIAERPVAIPPWMKSALDLESPVSSQAQDPAEAGVAQDPAVAEAAAAFVESIRGDERPRVSEEGLSSTTALTGSSAPPCDI